MSGLVRQSVPRIEELSVKNYRALKDLQLKNLMPLTVFLDRMAAVNPRFSTCSHFYLNVFQLGLRKAWDKRGRFKELRTEAPMGNCFRIKISREIQFPDHHLSPRNR